MAVPTRIELAIFCVTGRRDNRYTTEPIWLRKMDLNQRPSGYEPDELPNCSIPRYKLMAEKEGFEPPRQLPDLPVFKTGPFSHLGISPHVSLAVDTSIIIAYKISLYNIFYEFFLFFITFYKDLSNI